MRAGGRPSRAVCGPSHGASPTTAPLAERSLCPGAVRIPQGRGPRSLRRSGLRPDPRRVGAVRRDTPRHLKVLPGLSAGAVRATREGAGLEGRYGRTQTHQGRFRAAKAFSAAIDSNADHPPTKPPTRLGELRLSPILGSSCASSCVQALRGGGGRGWAQASHHAPAQADGVRTRVWRAADPLNRTRAAGGLTYRRQSSAVGVSRPQRADSFLRRIAGGAPRVDPRIRHRPA